MIVKPFVCCSHTCYYVGMVSVNVTLCNVSVTYQSRSSELAEAVPIAAEAVNACLNNESMHLRQLNRMTVLIDLFIAL